MTSRTVSPDQNSAPEIKARELGTVKVREEGARERPRDREKRWSRCLETGAILGNVRDPGGLGEGPWGKLGPSTPTRLAFPTAEPNPPGCLHPLNLAPEVCGPRSTGTHTALTRGGWGWARGR